MKTRRLRAVIAVVVAALAIGAIAATASAAAPKPVHAGSSGNPKLDDICRQIADLIDNEIAEGNLAYLDGDFGSANAWWNQATEHIARARGLGCVLARRASGGSTSTGSGATTVAKKISGSGGGGKGQFSKQACINIGTWASDAMTKSDDAQKNGDTDLANGWRQHADELLSSGRKNGCKFTASRTAPK